MLVTGNNGIVVAAGYNGHAGSAICQPGWAGAHRNNGTGTRDKAYFLYAAKNPAEQGRLLKKGTFELPCRSAQVSINRSDGGTAR